MGVACWVWLTRLTGGDSSLLFSRPEAEPRHWHPGIGFVRGSLQAQRREGGGEGSRQQEVQRGEENQKRSGLEYIEVELSGVKYWYSV